MSIFTDGVKTFDPDFIKSVKELLIKEGWKVSKLITTGNRLVKGGDILQTRPTEISMYKKEWIKFIANLSPIKRRRRRAYTP